VEFSAPCHANQLTIIISVIMGSRMHPGFFLVKYQCQT